MLRTIVGTLFILAALAPNTGFAQAAEGGGELPHDIRDNASAEIDAIFPAIVARARAMGLEPAEGAIAPAIDRATAAKLAHPLRLKPQSPRLKSNGVSNYVDHDATTALLDFSCGTNTYDGHRGIDYSFGHYSWRTMDAGDVEIVAAAPGTILEKADGQYDRQCNWTNAPANYVIVLQDDGLYAFYWHMRKNSLTTKAVGARVAKGEYLGLVGSSGNSNGPHLHFELREVRNDGNTKADPYAGLCTQPASDVSLWQHQHETQDTDIIRVATHAATPPSITYPFASPNFCGTDGLPINPDPQYSNSFAPGATVYLAVYLKDQKTTTPVTMELFRPNGTLYSTGGPATASAFFKYAYWWWSRVLPTDSPGLWRVRMTIDGRSAEHAFHVGATPAPATTVLARLEPQARSPKTEVDTTTTLYAKNTGTSDAEGCWIEPDYPLASTFKYELLDTAGAVVGLPMQMFSIPAGATQRVRVTFRPKLGYAAFGIEIPMRVKCLNAMGPPPRNGLNTMWLSFQDTRNVDVITTIATPGASGILQLPTSGSRDYTVTTRNVGRRGRVRVRPYQIGNIPVTATICELDTAGACLAPHAASILRIFESGEIVRWQLRLTATAPIVRDEVTRRVIVELKDAFGIIRGQSSVAVWRP